jgi:hypothetical protein
MEWPLLKLTNALKIANMCIISDSVKHVAATKLFAMPSVDGLRQLTVYTNTVDTAKTNVMCLPVPNPGTVKFETVPDNFFKQCEDSIQKELLLSARSWSLSLSSDGASYLAVQSHGSYDVVTVPSMADLDRVPPAFATLTEDVKNFLRSNYPADYGVLLCRLRVGSTRYEPFAYSHAMTGDRLFYGGSSNAYSDMGSHSSYADFMSGRSYSMAGDHDSADWDHEIYTIMTHPREAHNTAPRKLPKERNAIDWANMPIGFRLNPGAHVKLFEREGSGFANEDLQFRVDTAWIH